MATILQFPTRVAPRVGPGLGLRERPTTVAEVMQQAMEQHLLVRIAYEPVNAKYGEHHEAGWRTVAVYDTYENAKAVFKGGPSRTVWGYWAYDFEENHPYRLRGERITEAQLTNETFELPQR